MNRIFIFRHGQTDWNAEGRIQGHLDVPLNERGRAQAALLINPLRKLRIVALLSSDLSRARDSAQIVADALGLSVHTDPGLREIHLGKLQGLTREDILEKYGSEFSDRLRHHPLSDADIAQLGSESGEQVTTRALGAIRRIFAADGALGLTSVTTSASGPGASIAVATHGGVIRRVIQLAAGDARFPSPIANCVLYSIRYRPATMATAEAWELEDQIPLR